MAIYPRKSATLSVYILAELAYEALRDFRRSSASSIKVIIFIVLMALIDEINSSNIHSAPKMKLASYGWKLRAKLLERTGGEKVMRPESIEINDRNQHTWAA